MKVRVCQLDGINPLKTLPLAAGLLAAAANAEPGLSEWGRELRIVPGDATIEEAAADCRAADVLALSLYPWNLNHSLEVARRVKAQSRSCLIVAGGPSVPHRRAAATRFLQANDALDVLAFGEGEETFPTLLRARANGRGLGAVPGIARRTDRVPDGVEFTGPGDRVRPDSTCSPYLDGTFDRLLTRIDARPVAAILETNRGCPFRCAFCSRGHETHDPIAEVPAERVLREIEWIGDNRIPYLYLVDANFGIRTRDLEIARHVADVRRKTGYPDFCYAHLRKNAREGDLAIPEALLAGGVRTQVAFATQDFEEPVLRAVRRRNPGPREIRQLRRICHERGIPTFDEILLGLPRQTYQSFVRTLGRATSPLPDDTFFLYLCRVAENSEMARPGFRRRHGIETRTCIALPTDGRPPPEVAEHEEIVVATRDMPRGDWERAFRLGYFTVAAHSGHLLRTLIRHVRDLPDADPGEFLEGLMRAVENAPEAGVLGAFRRTFDRTLESIDRGGPFVVPVEGSDSPPREMADALTILALSRPDEFFEEVLEVAREFASSRGDPVEVVDDLMAFESFRTPRFGIAESREREFRYDWPSYLLRADQVLPAVPGAIRLVYRPPPSVSASTRGEFYALHLAAIHSRGDRGQLRRVADTDRDAS